MRMKKYEITDIAHPDNPKLHRIRALTDVGTDVHKGDLGGFVETEDGIKRHHRLPAPKGRAAERPYAEDARKNQAKGENTVNGLEQISQQRRTVRTAVF